MTNKAHSRLSCSGSKRWINCPASVALAEKAPKPPESPYALEGTEAHAMAEQCLKSWTDAPNTEMGEAVQVYLDFVRSLATNEEIQSGKKIFFIEQKFNLGYIHPDCFGSNDCSVYDSENKKLYVVDYKHGQGVIVSAEWNSQLMMYALGACHSVWTLYSETKKSALNVLQLIESVDLVIVQPRAFSDEGPVKTFTISTKDLYFWALNVLKPATVLADQPNAPMRVGEHCRFCPAIAICPAQAETAMAIAKTDFKSPVFPNPQSLSPEEIRRVLEFSEMLDTWIGQVKAYAQARLEGGTRIEGFKLVQRKANRKWLSEDQAAGTLEILLGDDAYEKSLISIAKAEKALKKLKQDPEKALRGLWHKPDAGVTIVKEDDKRKEVASTSLSLFLEDADFLQ